MREHRNILITALAASALALAVAAPKASASESLSIHDNNGHISVGVDVNTDNDHHRHHDEVVVNDGGKRYEGRVVSLNEPMGKVVIKMDDSTGNWRVGDRTVVTSEGGRVGLRALLGSRRVEAFVGEDGFVRRINILEMKSSGGGSGRAFEGKVVMLNEREGRIEIQTDSSRGHWRVDGNTRVSDHGADASLADALHSGRVRAIVSKDGRVQRIEILGSH